MINLYDIWFADLEIKNSTKLKLLDKYNTEEIYKIDKKILTDEKLEKNEEEILLNKVNIEHAKMIQEYLVNHNIKLISVKSEEYPNKLHNIDDKPAFLYVRGDLSALDGNSVGIVGCRRASENGKLMARVIAKSLANRGVNIISGLAVGIDKYAHLGCLDSEIGKTVAVLGGPVTEERLYPRENLKVYERILESGGAVISEYGIYSEPEPHHFPARNRIISGLSEKIIVVEAKKRSGSLITANWALEQGKDVYAVPGTILAKNSEGTNNLIKDGAYLLSNIDDILFNDLKQFS